MSRESTRALFRHGLRIYLRTLTECARVLRRQRLRRLLFFAFQVPVRAAFVFLTLRLDDLFFRGYRSTRVDRPVFIISHPRSGTTFLHSVLADTAEFNCFRVWEIYHPSLTVRALLRRSAWLRRLLSTPLAPVAEPHSSGAARAGDLDRVAPEDEMLFTHVLDTQWLSFSLMQGFSPHGYPDLVFNDEQPHRRPSARFFRACLQRKLHEGGSRRALVRANYSVFRLRTLLEEFPDAKVIRLVRSPLATIPSHLALQGRILNTTFGPDGLRPEARTAFFANRYRYDVEHHRYYETLLGSPDFPAECLLELRYRDLVENFDATIQRVWDFVEIEPSSAARATIQRYASAQPAFRRDAAEPAWSEWGLSRERICEDLAFAFDRYEFDRAAGSLAHA